MKALPLVLSISLLVAGLSGCGGSPEPNSRTTEKDSTGPVRERLDCGSSKAGSEDALRQFTAVLRRGNEREIRSVLIDRPRFFALSAYGHPGPRVGVRGDPRKAAQAVARRGGLPVTIDRFMNSEAPHRTTDLGFEGRWNDTRHMIGKAAIDCRQGKVITFNVAVRRAAY